MTVTDISLMCIFDVSLRSYRVMLMYLILSVLKHYDVTVIVKYDCFTACAAG